MSEEFIELENLGKVNELDLKQVTPPRATWKQSGSATDKSREFHAKIIMPQLLRKQKIQS